jgi:hypothetical protein
MRKIHKNSRIFSHIRKVFDVRPLCKIDNLTYAYEALLDESYEFLRLTTTKDENGNEITKYEIFEKEQE